MRTRAVRIRNHALVGQGKVMVKVGDQRLVLSSLAAYRWSLALLQAARDSETPHDHVTDAGSSPATPTARR
jgi:hypothetical protein